MAIELPYESDDFTPFPYQGELTSDNLNQFPKQIKEDLLALRDRTDIIQNNVLAFLQRASEYDKDANYMKDDIVRTASGVNYISLIDNNKGNELTDTNYWVRWYVPDMSNQSMAYEKTEFIADDDQTEFNVSVSKDYTDIYLNGVKLSKENDYTLKDDLTGFDLKNGASKDDVIECIVWTTSSILSIHKVRRVFSSTLLKDMDVVVCLTDGDSGFTLTLPTKPVNGSMIKIVDGRDNAQNNPIKLVRQDATINNKKDDVTLDVNGFNVFLTYDYFKNDWSLSYN